MNAEANTREYKIIKAAGLEIVSEIGLSAVIHSVGRSTVVLPDMSAELAPRDLLLPWQYRKVVQYIEEHLTDTITVDELASLTKLSKTYFSRIFKTSFNESPYSYVLRRRMELAKDLIVGTNAALSEIALDCGMSDQAHLCKTFKKVFGTTPKYWRRPSLGTDGTFERKSASSVRGSVRAIGNS